ncbi:transcription factor with AP2 domain-containing protein, putative [Babesia ovata]|uniref:Transcription factor with AP2 domain-containing protein, putative n=1 Tax=Babesia ovata TaxID=189622 RepID=A0A2H6K850_9APIC|nr:transcription factor with AP2 domain-containing protein, putative [Babesia ovata]GBE59160.1 transcription factor with AP2 domain-containing protein, putative [Babesia ovata]
MLSACELYVDRLLRCSRRCFSSASDTVAVTSSLGRKTAASRRANESIHASDGDEHVNALSVSEQSWPGPPASPAQSTRPRLVHHVFRWGVGNAFRAHSKNRFQPTHAERNTAVSLYEGYFDCDRKFQHCKIAYDRLNEQWEVLWTEFGKLNGKPFPVKKFGVEASKAESIAFAEELDRRLIEELKDNPESPKSMLCCFVAISAVAESGVTFDHTLHCWVALGRVRGRPAARAFSADYHGYEGALKRASDFRTG